jgi:1-deoxy-D-xylulose-5-phosphate reductoisomerase
MLSHLNKPTTNKVSAIKQVVILGATGSIGKSTLDVLSMHSDSFRVLGLSAYSRMEELAYLIARFKPLYIAVPDDNSAKVCVTTLTYLSQLNNESLFLPTILLGERGLCDLASLSMATHVVAAIVGAAGLPSCLAAAHAGKTILLANKEALVMSGRFFLDAVHLGGATLLPLDSEHNALFQCLPVGQGLVTPSVRNIWLTASGGPFLSRPLDSLLGVTPDEACKHPKWSMGRKISVDSATLMNKGLEVIEAALMYGLTADRVKVVVHPQSMIHALVQYIDGSLLAHLSNPDMRVPIAHALAYNSDFAINRIESGVPDLDMQQLSDLHFSAPDLERFPCLALAYQALNIGQHACIALNAANEIAVAEFLSGNLSFICIGDVVAAVLKRIIAADISVPTHLLQVYELDKQCRIWALEEVILLNTNIKY